MSAGATQEMLSENMQGSALGIVPPGRAVQLAGRFRGQAPSGVHVSSPTLLLLPLLSVSLNLFQPPDLI